MDATRGRRKSSSSSSSSSPSPPPLPDRFSAESMADGAQAAMQPSMSLAASRRDATWTEPLAASGRGRSRSTGHEALRRLSKAFPSLPTSLFAGLTGQQNTNTCTSGSNPRTTSSMSTAVQARTRPVSTGLATKSRPAPLRRVTSDDSLLYHSLSRASSLGDDERFHDVREMVNIRLMALKDSLPDVPNFKVPGFAKLQAASRMSSISLNGFFSGFSDEDDKSRVAPPPVAVPEPAPTATKATRALDRVLDQLTGDIVVLGGYRGSVLRSAEPPHQQLWAPVKLGFNMRKANLEVGLDDDDEASMEERIIPSGMLQNVGPVDISRKLFKRLRSCPNARSGKLRVWDYGYDWRLSPALSSRRLLDFIASLPCNQHGVNEGAVVIAHSLGGLVTRHAVNQRPDLFAGVLYAGVPQRCVNILGPLRNGDAVLFNEKLLTAQVNFSIRTSFALLPDDGFCFVNKETGEPYPVDFFDADDWIRWRPPSPPNRDRSIAYLRRVLAATRRFRNELSHRPDLEASNAYPPHALLYGKSIPTVYAAQVPSRDAIRAADAYDDLLFRPGDGVVLAREAMLPEGYALVRAGRVCTERGHLTMLGDLSAVARALEALVRGRNKGIGLGRLSEKVA
ncbi:hypothetical protein CDD80_4125 [Ophiocordyceps camponoti-rufipedis]|uniref:Uncharacterized protein n=1 Tax=Ophiocordyceps camponoti-rufipedis TaxID=2004952 RepID=A0A2C5Z0W8_9HYPO|nr:hypothetical protein CDD80_4125 [Ophiocordyceps camponoti-rufipedis]